MKLFEEREFHGAFEEREFHGACEVAAAGGQALYLFNDPGVYPRAPMCFKKSKQAAHLFDQDKKRLINGVKVIKVSCVGTSKQHIDLCGMPLKRAIEICGK